MNHPWEDLLILDLRVRFSSAPNLPWIPTLTSQFTGDPPFPIMLFPLLSSLVLNLFFFFFLRALALCIPS
jgi:hypothetical protein